MPNLDDELRRRMQHAGRRVDTDGLEGRLHERRARKQITQKVGRGFLAVAVLAGSAVGVAGLNRAFRGDLKAGDDLGSETVGFVRNLRPCISVRDIGNDGGLQIFTVDVATGEQRRIPITYTFGDARRSMSPTSPDFSPDGTKVAYVEHYTRDLFVTDVVSGATSRLTNALVVEDGPRWSPDGTTIAFQVSDTSRDGELMLGESSPTGVYTVRPDGSALTHLTDGGSPIWTSDGRIAFERRSTATVELNPDTGEMISEDPGRITFFTMNANGSDVEQQYEAPADVPIGEAEWSPGGDRIVGSATLHGNVDIFSVDLTLRVALRLTDDPAQDTSPSWNPDGSRIAFHSGRWGTGVGHSEIAVMDADGSGVQRLTDDCWDDYDATWILDDEAVGMLPVWALGAPPLPTATSSPLPIAEPSPVNEERRSIPGLEGKLCNVASTVADFGQGEPGTAYVFERQTGDDPGCPDPGDGDAYVAIALVGARYSAAAGPLSPCAPVCAVIGTVDLNDDGVDEVIVGTRIYYPTAPVTVQVYAVARPSSAEPSLVEIVRDDGGPLVISWGGATGSWDEGVTCAREPVPTFTYWQGTSPDAGTSWEWRKTVYSLDVGPDQVVARAIASDQLSTTNPDGPKLHMMCGEDIQAG